jgi:RNA polymerase sigma-70 factor, ECF subfamily
MTNYSKLTEEDLAAKVSVREMDAIAELYKRHKLRLYSIALTRLGDEELAADAVEDVFDKIIRNGAPGYMSGESLVRYLTTAIVNRILDYFKKSRRREQAYHDYSIYMDTARRTQHDPLDYVYIIQLIDQQIAALPREMRKVLTLSLKHHLDAREIADILGKPLATVHTQLRDGRKKIRPALRRWLGLYIWYWLYISLVNATPIQTLEMKRIHNNHITNQKNIYA